MQGASRESLAAARDRLDGQLGGAAEPEAVAGDLFGVVALLDREPALRRALSDPSTAESARTGLLERVLGQRVSAAPLEILRGVVAARWSRPPDLPDAVEALARQVVFVQAERDGLIDEVEDELFRFDRIVDREPRLAAALTDRAVPVERRLGLLDALIEGKVAPATRRLLDQAVWAPRGQRFERIVERLSDEAAVRRDRRVARVRSATELSADQERRLAAALARIYRRDVLLQVEIDPDLLGGLVVQVGDDVIDGSVLRRLDEASRGLAR